jgi:cytochrome c peroxidase
MHSGRYETLKESIQFYNDGRGNAIPEGEQLYLHWHISSPNLTDDEVDLIVEFLGTLTDESLTPQIPEQLPSGLEPIGNKTQQAKNNNKSKFIHSGDSNEIN